MNHLIGYYSTKFGELWEQSLYDMVREAINGAVAEAGIEPEQIDAVFYGNMMGGILENNVHATAKIAGILGRHIPVYRLEAACASGGMAFQMADTWLKANPDKIALVVGAEKMTDVSVQEITRALSAAASGEEQAVGLTFPGLYGMLAQYYLKKYHYTEEALAEVAVKNHYHGTLNEKAQFKKEITVEAVMNSTYVAKPLKMLDSSPISDGAAAVLLTNNPLLVKNGHSVRIIASTVATDSISLKNRKRLDGLDATKIAAEQAFTQAGIKREEVHIAELHDCFTIAELMAMEDIGFWKQGEAGARIKEKQTTYGSGSSLIVNTSGGLKAAGHPVGATGIKQLGEVYLQLTGKAGKRQLQNVQYGLAHNVGGSGGTAVVTILGV
jgi:acetyl-CoA C-acetyltransferase